MCFDEAIAMFFPHSLSARQHIGPCYTQHCKGTEPYPAHMESLNHERSAVQGAHGCLGHSAREGSGTKRVHNGAFTLILLKGLYIVRSRLGSLGFLVEVDYYEEILINPRNPRCFIR